MFAFNAGKSYQALLGLYRDADAMLQWPDAQLSEAAPDCSAWSPAQHLIHIAKTNETIVEIITKLAAGDSENSGGRATFLGSMLLLYGRIPRRRARADIRLRPPERVDRDFLADEWQQSYQTVQSLEALLQDLAQSPGRHKHYIFGQLDGRQWLRFARIHTAHHLLIIDDIHKSAGRNSAAGSRQ